MPESGGTVNGQNQEPPSPAGPTSVRDVFVSYASQDAAIANSVVEALERNDITCWIAPRDVIAGEFYADAIVHAIDASRVLVLILSQHAAASPHILREVERASAQRHPVISLRIEPAPLPSGLEYFLNTSQWLDASNGETNLVLPKLIEAVRRAQRGGSARTATASAAPPPTEWSTPARSKRLIERDHSNDNSTEIGLIYANRGDVDQAFKWLDRAYRQHEGSLGMIKVNPLLKNVQADPRFNQLLIKLGLQN